jgi:hypothetical protein
MNPIFKKKKSTSSNEIKKISKKNDVNLGYLIRSTKPEKITNHKFQ